MPGGVQRAVGHALRFLRCVNLHRTASRVIRIHSGAEMYLSTDVRFEFVYDETSTAYKFVHHAGRARNLHRVKRVSSNRSVYDKYIRTGLRL
ncbi:protein of unknown function [Caballeronia sp. S22]